MTEYTELNHISPNDIEPNDRVTSIGAFHAAPHIASRVTQVEQGYNLDNDLVKITFEGELYLVLSSSWMISVERPEVKDVRALYIFKNHPNREASVQLSGNLYNNATRIVGIGKDNLGVVYKED